MAIQVKKIIHQRDYTERYHSVEFNFDEEVDYPYLAGKIQPSIPDKAKLDTSKRMVVEQSLFNQSGLTKIVADIGPKGLYILELRPEHKLKTLIVEPDEVVVDLFFGAGELEGKIGIKTLVYSFYNPTRRNHITITASIEKDTEDIYSKLKADPENIIWRQYFIRRALHKSDTSSLSIPKIIYPELMTVAQVADYLQLDIRTIRNWTSQNKIPFKKIGSAVRYKKSEIDKSIESLQMGRTKKTKR